MRSQPVRVAIDLETTGLHHEQDVIIEVGAVKFAGSEVLDTFASLVSINMSLPYRIQRLTGIRPDELRSAPPLSSLHGQLRTFLGDAPLVGHNVGFDVAFLQKVGLARRNPLIDTWELASLLLPNQPNYSLGALGEALGIPADVHHRALADAQLTHELFLLLLQRIETTEASLARTLRDLPAAPEWTPRYFLRGGNQRREQPANAFGHALTASLGDQFARQLGVDPDVLTLAVAQETPIPESTTGAVEPAPPTALAPAVDSLAREMVAALDEGGTLLAEALPGDLDATLEPVARWLVAHEDERLMVAVATREQLAQLAREKLPALFRRIGVSLPIAEVMRRDEYLCLHRWFGQARIPDGDSFSREMTRGLARLAVWLQTTQTGARVDVALSGPENIAWERVRGGAEHAEAMATCNYLRDGYCFFTRARQKAQDARVLVTTHEALAERLASGNDDSLPECRRVLVLDSHVFEENVRKAREVVLDQRRVSSALDDLAREANGKPGGGLLRQAAGRIEHASLRSWYEQVTQARQASERLFVALRRLLQEAHAHGGEQGHVEPQEQRVLRLDARARQHDAWDDVAAAWRTMDARLAAVAKVARETARALSGGKNKQAPDSLASELSAVAWRLNQMREEGARLLLDEGAHEPMVVWLRLPYPQNGDRGDTAGRSNRWNGRKGPRKSPENGSQPQGQSQPEAPAAEVKSAVPTVALAEEIEPVPEIHGEPNDIGPLLQPLSAPGRSLTLAGSALTVAGDFEPVRVSLGLPENARFRCLSSDRSAQTLLCLPVDVPEPNAPHYQQRLNAALIGLASALEGRLVAIFSSHAALRSAWMGIRRELEQKDILVLAQGQDGSARQLWRTFETESRVVLLGAGSFWDGAARTVNPPACVVVTRMPFPALSDPPVAARAERWPDPQSGFVVPQGALRLRQALNGLAWSHQQRNAVVLFDRRIQTRGYGPAILGTLPRCEQYEESLAQITERVTDWVDASR
ncbi:MAG TPA: exonuclease domain-containing protein [Ktedonobacterales bacterium]|nr:exonuclease domain-containing protein [Ktedonobacterales bacterium]